MNEHVSKAEVDAGAPYPPHYLDVEGACFAVWHACMMLGATTRHPSVEYVYEARKAVYDEAVAELKKVLDNG